MKYFLMCVLVFLVAIGASASEERVVLLKGEVPKQGFPQLEENIDSIWGVLAKAFNLDDKTSAPVVFFSDFTKSKQSSSLKGEELNELQLTWVKDHPEIWQDWAKKHKVPLDQITKEWIRENADKKMAFPKDFVAFQYYGTNALQVSPGKTYYAHFQNDSQNRKRDMTGFGYYATGHEMSHYILSQQGIEPRLQHCLMHRTSMMQKFVSYLQDIGLGKLHLRRYVGLSERFCNFLTDEEKLKVDELHEEYNNIKYDSGN